MGNLKGADAFLLLTSPGVKHGAGIEGRGSNIANARLAQDLLKVGNTSFIQASLEDDSSLDKLGNYDVIFCSR